MIVRGSTERRRRRRGITIIETTVMMTGLALMLGMCASLLELLMRTDADCRARIDGAAALSRLEEQFREDVHLASSASVGGKAGEPGSRLRLAMGPARDVEYESASPADLVRVEHRNGAVARRERYRLPSRSPAWLELREDAGLRFAVVGIERRTGDLASTGPRRFEVVSVVGKDRGLSATPHVAPGGGGSR